MLLGVAVGRSAVNAETYAVVGFGKILEEVKGRPALPPLQIDLLSIANHDFYHLHMVIAEVFSVVLPNARLARPVRAT